MAKKDRGGGCLVLALIVGFLFFVSRCDRDPPVEDSAQSLSSSVASPSGGPAAVEPVAMYVTAASVNCRASPTTGASIVARLDHGSQVSVSTTESGWGKVDDHSCWISLRFLSETRPAPLPAARPSPRAARPLGFTSDLSRSASGGRCGSKRYCGQMNSCAEARFYLNECGVGRLDRDDDGIPCESIC